MFNTRYYQASDFGTTLESQLNYVLKLGIIKGLNMTHNKVLYN
jgi:hypothetical protein